MPKGFDSPDQTIYQLKVTLRNSRPPIWRRLLVPGNINLYQLHQVLQLAMGWTNSHLHQFIIDGEYYSIPSPEDWEPVIDERRHLLSQIAPAPKRKFIYEYDFGDGWEHVIMVERITSPEAEVQYPVCINGKRACPPEDVGGFPGFEMFLDAINDPAHEEHDSYLEWWGGEFDPEDFDLDGVNYFLQRISGKWGNGLDDDELDDEFLEQLMGFYADDEFFDHEMDWPSPVDVFLPPTPSDWSKLYAATVEVKELAPWEWMSEMDIFGVQDPETNEIGFVSVMGELGEHYSIAVYQGARGLYRLWHFQQLGTEGDMEDLLAIPHLQASFEDRGELTKQDRDLIKELGLKFRGRQAWPLFRSYRPGYFPWYLDAQEARFLLCVLEQALDVLPRIKEDPAILESLPTQDDLESILVRVASEDEGKLIWEDQFVTVLPPEPEPISISLDMRTMEALKSAELTQMSFEIDLFMFPAQVGERGSRPRYSHMLLIVDSESGMVFGNELMLAAPTLEAMYGKVPETIVRTLARIGVVPAEVRVRSELIYQLVEIIGQDLGFKVLYSPQLPSLDEARAFMTGMLAGQSM